jgi:hypothetical protein
MAARFELKTDHMISTPIMRAVFDPEMRRSPSGPDGTELVVRADPNTGAVV